MTTITTITTIITIIFTPPTMNVIQLEGNSCYLLTMLLTLTVLIAVCIVCWILDKLINVKNVISYVQYPQHLSSLPITPGGQNLPCNVTYLPPAPGVNPETANVYLLVSGNPGNPWFYVDFMREVQSRMNGNIHIYCVGHIYHASQIDNDVYQQFNKISLNQANPQGLTACDLNIPRFDTQRLSIKPDNFEKSPGWKDPNELAKYIVKAPTCGLIGEGWFTQSEGLGLYDNIAQKMSVLSEIRRLHPNAKIMIGGHSMGSYCWLEMLRTMERAYVYKHFGEDGLIVWDSEQNKLTVDDVENEQIPIKVLSGTPQVIQDFENKISRILYSPEELEFWSDNLLINVPAPSTKFQPSEIKPGTDEFVKAFHDFIESQVVENALTPILQFHGLLPTIARIANTPNGHFMTPWFFRPNILSFASQLLARIPPFVKRVLFNFPAPFYKYPDVHIAIRLFFNLQGITNMISLAKDEMVNIRSLDLSLFQRHAEKIWLYMSDVDEWAPTYQREYYQAVNTHWKTMGKKEFAVQVDTQGVPHAFCFGGNQILAGHMVQHVNKCHPDYFNTSKVE